MWRWILWIWQTRKVQWKNSISLVNCVIFNFTWKSVVVFLCICSDDGEEEEDLQEMHIVWNTKWMSKYALWTNTCSVTFENYYFQIKRMFRKGKIKVEFSLPKRMWGLLWRTTIMIIVHLLWNDTTRKIEIERTKKLKSASNTIKS